MLELIQNRDGPSSHSKHQYVIFILLMQGFRSSDCSKSRLLSQRMCAFDMSFSLTLRPRSFGYH